MLKELVHDVLLRNRPEHTEVVEYGNYNDIKTYNATYFDDDKCYRTRINSGETFSVNSSKAFIAYIQEELHRRNNSDGKYATVRIHSDGGNFTADCNFNVGHCSYKRLHSEQYNILKTYNNQTLDHEQFLLMLQKLKPSIQDFATLYKRCQKIRSIGQTALSSNPIFDENGEADSSYICTYKLSDGTDEDVSLPAEFFVTCPFVKAGEKTYTYHVELLFFNTGSSKIAVKVQVTDWETVEEQAIIDEAESIKSSLKTHEELLVLADF